MSTRESAKQILGDVGKYRVLAELGTGGTATASLAVAQGAGGVSKLVVLKALRPHIASEPAFLRMFLSEARLAARLNHPNVVQTYEVGQEAGRDVIVMEYLEGQSLANVVARARSTTCALPLGLHLRIIADSLAGLQYAHELKDFHGESLGLVHRDVSPHNVFVTYDGQVKLLDFGMAKAVTSTGETETGTFKGKVGYMAPEQIVGEVVDRRADLYSAGVMLWEAGTGDRMWKDVPDATVIHRVVTEEIPSARERNPEIPENLLAVIEKALAPSPEDRYATAADLEAAIEDVLVSLHERPSHRDVGAFVSVMFSDMRAEIARVIDSQLMRAATMTSEEYATIEPASIHFNVARTMGTLKDGGAQTGSYRPTTRVRRGVVLGMVAVVLIAVSGFGVRFLSRKPAHPVEIAPVSVALGTASAPVALPQTVVVRIEANPANARLFFDNEAIAANPAVLTKAADHFMHTVRIEMDGFVTQSVPVVLDKDSNVSVVLLRVAPRARSSTSQSRPKPIVTETKPTVDCAQPFYVDERGIKTLRPECR